MQLQENTIFADVSTIPDVLFFVLFFIQRSALECCVKGWGVSVLVGWTDMHDFAARPIQLIAGRTWKGSLFGGD